jgi:excisionase family DNA binding protein
MAAAPRIRLVSVDTAAQLLGIGRTTVYDLVNRGVLRSMKIGRRTLLPIEDIDAFVDQKLASA